MPAHALKKKVNERYLDNNNQLLQGETLYEDIQGPLFKRKLKTYGVESCANVQCLFLPSSPKLHPYGRIPIVVLDRK
jgi:hypothetical protein